MIDYFQLIDLISMNQQYLQEFGVSGNKIDEVIEIMMMNNVHGKLTGGGGEGGCVIGFYVPQSEHT